MSPAIFILLVDMLPLFSASSPKRKGSQSILLAMSPPEGCDTDVFTGCAVVSISTSCFLQEDTNAIHPIRQLIILLCFIFSEVKRFNKCLMVLATNTDLLVFRWNNPGDWTN